LSRNNSFGKQVIVRWKRLGKHLIFPFYKGNQNDFVPSSILEWMSDLWFYIMDVLGIPEVYQLIIRLIKWNTRKLNDAEINIARQVFGTNLDYEVIRIDDAARFGTKKIAAAYVSFNTINYNKKIKKEIFVHELVHIWQYQHFGSIYIARAIKAQFSKAGYDYGGVSHLYHQMLKGGKLIDFNFEQQADIIEDYYRIMMKPQSASPLDHSIYQYFAEQLVR